MTNALMAIGFPIFVTLALLVTGGLMLSRLYKRATREISFVRTGLGGRKVVVDGGALVLPTLQEMTPVNMKTLRLSVTRRGNDSLTTQEPQGTDEKGYSVEGMESH